MQKMIEWKYYICPAIMKKKQGSLKIKHAAP